MASASLDPAGAPDPGQLLLDGAASQGSLAHPYASSPELLQGPDAARNLADLIHFLCILHGRYPGVIDHAADFAQGADARAWLSAAAEDFAIERGYVAALAAAAGPVPGTPGAQASESAVIGQRHAIEMLAKSERSGCALGAAMAVMLDWAPIRSVLDVAGRRFGLEWHSSALGGGPEIAAAARRLAATPAAQRAMQFGATQIYVQHRGLWDLLEARRIARG